MIRPIAIGALLIATSLAARAQEKPDDIKILPPTADKTAASVTLPAAFWNEHSADWVETAFCGRPSDFSHETVLTATTTRTLMEKALRDIGCRDGDAWVDGFADFARVRGDQFIVLLTFDHDGKKQTWSMDELLTFSHWGVPLGPYGFMFKGDPEHTAAPPASAPADLTDASRILHDDPQIALVFKGLQARSHSFADHPLAYLEDPWPFEEIDRARNRAALPAAVYDSNGKIPVTVTFKRVSAEGLLTENAAVWHDDAFKAYMLERLPAARQIDADKKSYLALRQGAPADRAAHADELAALLASIDAQYAALDDAWSSWAASHLKPDGEDDNANAFVRDQARRWGQFMSFNRERTAQLAQAQQFARQLQALPQPPDARRQAQLQGGLVAAQSKALVAENTLPRAYWQKQWEKINDPKANDVWAQNVTLHLAQLDARLKSAAAAAAYGTALQLASPDAAQLAALKSALEQSVRDMNLADARLALASVDFEISKRTDTPQDPDLPELRRQHDTLTARIKELTTPKPGD